MENSINSIGNTTKDFENQAISDWDKSQEVLRKAIIAETTATGLQNKLTESENLLNSAWGQLSRGYRISWFTDLFRFAWWCQRRAAGTTRETPGRHGKTLRRSRSRAPNQGGKRPPRGTREVLSQTRDRRLAERATKPAQHIRRPAPEVLQFSESRTRRTKISHTPASFSCCWYGLLSSIPLLINIRRFD